MCSNILDNIKLGKCTGNFMKLDLYENSYFYIMKFFLDNFLCLLLIRSAEIYYGDSLKEIVFIDKSNG